MRRTRASAVSMTVAAARDAFVGRRVQVGSLFGSCGRHDVVTVVVVAVLEYTLSVRVRVDVVVTLTVTCDGRTVMVRVDVVDGTVTVAGVKVVVKPVVNVVVTVVEGVCVTEKVTVAVFVTVAGGPAMISKDLIHAKVKPSIITIQFPDHMEDFRSSSPGTLLLSSS